MAATKKHLEIQTQKSAVRDSITSLQQKCHAITTIPQRVINGSHQEAVAWKDGVVRARSARMFNAPPQKACTLEKLQEIEKSLKDSLSALVE